MYFAGISGDRVDIWDYQSKQHLTTLSVKTETPPTSFNEKLLCFSSDCRMLAVTLLCTGRVLVWNICDTGDCQQIRVLQHPDPVDALCFTKSSEQLVTGCHFELFAYDTATWELLRRYEVHRQRFRFIVPVGEGVLTACMDGMLKLWDAAFVEVLHHRLDDKILCGCISPLEDILAVSMLGPCITLVEVSTLTVMKVLYFLQHPACFSDLQFNSSGCRILGISRGSRNVYVYDVSTEVTMFMLSASGAACYSFDNTCIYRYCSEAVTNSNLLCADAETGAAMDWPFNRVWDTMCGEFHRIMVVTPAALILM
jgi:WD40 repeat protein